MAAHRGRSNWKADGLGLVRLSGAAIKNNSSKAIAVVSVVSLAALFAFSGKPQPEPNNTMKNLLVAAEDRQVEIEKQQALDLEAERLRLEAEVIAAAESEAEAQRVIEEARIEAIRVEEARVNRLRVPLRSGWYVTSPFGTRCDVLGAYNGCVTHTGLDFGTGAQTGWSAFPVAKGVVIGTFSYSGPWPTCGNYLAVYHEELGFTSIYCHLAAVYVLDGQAVDPDTALGEVGTTGMSTGIHLHLGFYSGMDFGSDASVFDPVPWMIENGLL